MTQDYQLDTLWPIETPEGVGVSLRPAGPVIRLYAFMIDSVFKYVLIGILAAFLAVNRFSYGSWFFFILFFVIEWFYPVLFEMFLDGQTPGKKFLGLQVLMDNGTPITWNASITRNLLRAADGFFILYLFGLLSLMFTKGFKRLGDLAAGTLVVYRNLNLNRLPYRPKATDSLVPAVVPPLPLTNKEKISLIKYSIRVPELGQARSEELAAILGEYLNQGLTVRPSAQQTLLGITAWIYEHSLAETRKEKTK